MSIMGARWWKLDVHTHTPASTDYGKGPRQAELRGISPAEWLRGFMVAGIDAVVVTDHNSGAWIDRLKESLDELRGSGDPGFRELTLFPGVEITASDGGHILAVLPIEAGTDKVVALLHEVGYRGTAGASDVAATSSPYDVVKAIVDMGGIPILAHVDGPRSVLRGAGNGLRNLLAAPGLFALEVCDPGWQPPRLYIEKGLSWARVLGSDSHHPVGANGPKFPGSHFTWVKCEQLTHEGLRLALLDGNDTSIRRSDDVQRDPNRFTHPVIERVSISDARYLGRSTPLDVPFSPWLTTIIGGRGSGKSSIVELLRLALHREDELPKPMKADLEKFRGRAVHRDDDGALLATTKVSVELRKDGHRYRSQWDTSGNPPRLEEERGGTWGSASGGVRKRFPVRIFSQGQIFELARDSKALLKIISEAPEIEIGSWSADWEAEKARFLSLRAKLRELEKQVSEAGDIEGTLADVTRKLAVFEQADHAQVLKDYQRSQQQRRAIEEWGEALGESEAALRTAAEGVAPPDLTLDLALFDTEHPAERAIADALAGGARDSLADSVQLTRLADELRGRRTAWEKTIAESAWARDAEQISSRYQRLVSELATKGITDVSQYGGLVQQRRVLEGRLRTLQGLRSTVDEVRAESERSLQRIGELRLQLTRRRQDFVDAVLRNNPYVRMKVEPYGTSAHDAEPSFREAVARTDQKLGDDILSEDGTRGRLARLYEGLPENEVVRAMELGRKIYELKRSVEQLAKDPTQRGWFARHVQQLPPEQLDKLLLWFPDDDLTVTYSVQGNGRDFRSIEQGSRGQKAAAILAFLLTHGSEPLILDQPEDDLDNELIYSLIVKQLRTNKLRRQVIIVTHNPNIVVNGDAELILVMASSRGRCILAQHGSLQLPAVSEAVCTVMEGGREALERRYRRMLAGNRRV